MFLLVWAKITIDGDNITKKMRIHGKEDKI